MNTPNDVVILSGARTPQGKILGQLASLTAAQLGAHARDEAAEPGMAGLYRPRPG